MFDGQYSKINQTIQRLKEKLKLKPDSEIAIYVAQLYLWQYFERFRQATIQPNINDNLIIAKYYLNFAHTLGSKNPRLDAWITSTNFEIAKQMNHKEKFQKALKKIDNAKENFVLFNHFFAQYVFANESIHSHSFKTLIKDMVATIRDTLGVDLDLNSTDLESQLKKIYKHPKRKNIALFSNQFAAPFSWQGYLLYLADLLTKNHQLTAASIIYKSLGWVPAISTWPFRWMIYDRLKFITKNEKAFQNWEQVKKLEKNLITKRSMIFNSYNCMVCHQTK